MRHADPLDALRIVTPCPIAWSDMSGDDRIRFCGRCRKNVYNVAEMSRSEALAVIERTEGRVCMRLTRRTDGTVVTGDCWTRLRQARRRGLLAFAAMLPVVLAAQLWAQGFGLRALGGLLRGRSSAPPPASRPAANTGHSISRTTATTGAAVVLGGIRPIKPGSRSGARHHSKVP
jgi:predicted Fe-S protein YdhL (DUF1289 family)